MKKISKMTWILLGAGIFIIAFACLYILYHQQGQEQQRLETSLSQAQTTLARANMDKADRESQLTQLEGEISQLEDELWFATSRLSSTRANLPASAESIEYDERLFEFAKSWRLDIVEITATEPRDEEIEGIVFLNTRFDVTVRGEVSDILAFINTVVVHPDFASATLDSVDMEVPKPLTEVELEEMTEEEIAEEMEARQPNAAIGITIYSYQGE